MLWIHSVAISGETLHVMLDGPYHIGQPMQFREILLRHFLNIILIFIQRLLWLSFSVRVLFIRLAFLLPLALQIHQHLGRIASKGHRVEFFIQCLVLQQQFRHLFEFQVGR
jgi:hypothetical protein